MQARLRLAVALSACLAYGGGASAIAQVGGDSVMHDPSRIIKDGNHYYVYGTALGGADGIFFKHSTNLTTWYDPYNNAEANAIFSDAPAWIASEVPGNDGTFWAPSVIKHGDEYRLYYSVSTFGGQESAIGLATNTTLNFTDPAYQWVDQGVVTKSEVGYPYNTIDASVLVDATDRMWMTFGSYWNGIFITELDPVSGKPYDATPAGATRIAGRSGGTDIEASYMHYHDGYYYLFVNWGSCCSGVDSTYEIRVGRSTSPAGPFVDNSAQPRSMISGGGTLFLDDVDNRIGPGHAGIFSEDGVDYFGYHFYDANSNGVPRFAIDELLWTVDGWPILLQEVLAADLSGDGNLTLRDWAIFRTYHLTDMSMLSPEVQAARGDLDGDGDNDFDDFRRFQTSYNALNGDGEFEAMLRAVPEPAAALLAAMASLLLLRRNGGKQSRRA